MIPVIPIDPPHDFDVKVRIPGQQFIIDYPNPTKDDYQKVGRHIYQKALGKLYTGYKKTCAYSAEWIPEKEKSIDHFIAKSVDRKQVFNWENFRLCSEQLNQYKGSESILDPFEIEQDWFIIDFRLNLVKPNSNLDPTLKARIQDTIKKLKLNETALSERRTAFIHSYYNGRPGINGLRKKAPFIVYELERQNLVEKIKEIHKDYLEAITTLPTKRERKRNRKRKK